MKLVGHFPAMEKMPEPKETLVTRKMPVASLPRAREGERLFSLIGLREVRVLPFSFLFRETADMLNGAHKIINWPDHKYLDINLHNCTRGKTSLADNCTEDAKNHINSVSLPHAGVILSWLWLSFAIEASSESIPTNPERGRERDGASIGTFFMYSYIF